MSSSVASRGGGGASTFSSPLLSPSALPSYHNDIHLSLKHQQAWAAVHILLHSLILYWHTSQDADGREPMDAHRPVSSNEAHERQVPNRWEEENMGQIRDCERGSLR